MECFLEQLGPMTGNGSIRGITVPLFSFTESAIMDGSNFSSDSTFFQGHSGTHPRWGPITHIAESAIVPRSKKSSAQGIGVENFGSPTQGRYQKSGEGVNQDEHLWSLDRGVQLILVLKNF